ncbi:hypothetical protein MPDQ_003829 [Monascus purpureus]|uniref:Regulator of phospholipase D SRF1 n=1 Tax=Monascus purpureus TaxID=5098 RepID=A0A507R2Q0_MONPU|nr:hypothetical protein MPDQ_003829 [Monascus purpureus]
MAQDERDQIRQIPDIEHDVCEKSLGNSQPTKLTPTQSPLSELNTNVQSIQPPRPSSHSNASPVAEASSNATAGVHLGLGIRTLPAWIRSVEYPVDDTSAGVTDRLLPSQPGDAVVAQHNHTPYTTKPGIRLSNEGEGSSSYPPRESRWKTFSEAIKYPPEQTWNEKSVTPEWLENNLGDYSQPWRGRPTFVDMEDPLNRRRDAFIKRFQNSLLTSPIVPLVFRLTVWCFSLIALALGGSIQHLSEKYKHPQGPSALMAIIVDAVALIYLVYITWDEYTSKPLGLRSSRSKTRLILLDLFFIVFDSANLSLAFEVLSDSGGSCTAAEINESFSPKNDAICDRQKALASVLLIALVAWLLTFAVSIFR